MGLGLPRVVTLALLGLSLAACAHGDTRIDDTPWAFAPRWDCGAKTTPYGCPGAVVVPEPVRFTQSQSTVAAAVSGATAAEPTVSEVERKPKKKRTSAKRRRSR
jgi:hypothetical protein